jgi:hypothetical protein
VFSIGLTKWLRSRRAGAVRARGAHPLAYYNVTEDELQFNEKTSRQYYDGLPVTTVALLVPLIYTLRPVMKSGFSALVCDLPAHDGSCVFNQVQSAQARLKGMMAPPAAARWWLVFLIIGWNKRSARRYNKRQVKNPAQAGFFDVRYVDFSGERFAKKSRHRRKREFQRVQRLLANGIVNGQRVRRNGVADAEKNRIGARVRRVVRVRRTVQNCDGENEHNAEDNEGKYEPQQPQQDSAADAQTPRAVFRPAVGAVLPAKTCFAAFADMRVFMRRRGHVASPFVRFGFALT